MFIKLEKLNCPINIAAKQIIPANFKYFFLDFVTFIRKPYPVETAVVNIAISITIP